MNAERARQEAREREERLKRFRESKKWKNAKERIESLTIKKEDKAFFLRRIESAGEEDLSTLIDLYLKIVKVLEEAHPDNTKEMASVMRVLIELGDYNNREAFGGRQQTLY